MKFNNITGYTFITFGLIYLINPFNVINPDNYTVISILLMIAGISAVYLSFYSNRRAGVYLATITFLYGICLYVSNHYSIIGQNIIYLPTIFFLTGAGFIMLFIENMKAKAFLISGTILIFFSLLFTFVITSGYLLIFANRISGYILDFWPAVLIIL